MLIEATILNMSDRQITDMVSPDVIDILKKEDPHPVIKAYSIGHEGISNSTLLKHGSKMLSFFRTAVVSMFENLKLGTKAFLGHAEGTNDHVGRTPIGRIVGRKLEDIGGVLHTVAAVHMFKPYSEMNLDVASIEAEVVYDQAESEVVKVANITGLALGNSEKFSPAFKGATLLATLQAFSKETNPMTKEEVKKAIKELSLNPLDLFEVATIMELQPVKDLDAKQKENYEHYRRVEKALGEERETAMTKEASLNTMIAELSKQAIAGKTAPLLSEVMTIRKLNDKQKSFISQRAKDFAPKADKDEDLKREIDTFVDSQLAEFDQMAKLFGDTSKSETPPTPPDKTTPLSDGPYSEFTDPKKNPFIPV